MKTTITTALLACEMILGVPSVVSAAEHPEALSVSVNVHSSKCVRVGLPHMKGVYLKSGSVRLHITIGDDDVRDFEIKEDLNLVAIHVLPPAVYLIFDPNFEPGRGFLAFKGTKGKSFEPAKLSDLPHEVIAPNFGTYASERDTLLSAKEPLNDSFFDTWAARLWSQIATGKAYLLWDVDREQVLKIWRQGAWRKSLVGTKVTEE